ncbi:MAG: hypothetical protein Q9191_002550 [Dirinaria sp. TL-2023a]
MAQQPPGPPYPPHTASLGGVPNVHTDVPITAVFLVLFILGAVAHMTIFQINQSRGHKFIMSGMLFGFCMARTVTSIMRIVWACRPTNVRIAIAAQVFVAAGVVLLFVINLIFAQRIIRAAHPHSGWHPAMSWFFKALYILIVVSLIMLITSVVQSFYTLNSNTRRIDRDIQLYGQTYYSVISFLPIPLVIIGLIIPRKTRVEKFGSGRFRSKIHILLWATALLCLGAAFRCGTNYKAPRPRDDPAWYHSKACFYIFNFTVEIIVIFLYVVVRVDKRFWVPNGSHGAGDYTRKVGGGGEEKQMGDGRSSAESRFGILPEEEVFDDETAEEVRPKQEPKDVETAA